MTRKMNRFALNGGWRKVICMPEDLKYEFGFFEQWNEDVLMFSSKTPCYVKNDIKTGFQFVSVQFSLEKSCYATMLIRELMHQSTEFKNQEFLFEKIRNFGGAIEGVASDKEDNAVAGAENEEGDEEEEIPFNKNKKTKIE